VVVVYAALLLALVPPLRTALQDLVDPDAQLSTVVWSATMRQLEAEDLAAPQLRPGQLLRAAGARPRHGVVFVPGIVSTQLEIWEGQPCMREFREVLWGGTTMAAKIVSATECWLAHISLNASSACDEAGEACAGGRADPDGIRVRATQGIDAH